MATIEQLEDALRKADAAGNVEDARQLASAIRSMRGGEFKPRHRSVEELRKGKGWDPTEGNSILKNAAIAYGKSYVDTGRGIKQLFGGLSQDDIDERRALDAPLMNASGSTIGNIAGQIVQLATPVPGSGAAKGLSALGRAAPYAKAAIQGGVFSGLQPVGANETRAGNALEGALYGAAGQGIASGAGKLARIAGDKLSPVVRESIELARAAGIPLNVAQVTESPVLKAMQGATKYLPFSGQAKAARGQQEAFNAAVGRSFGAMDAPLLTDDVMRGARQGLSSKFEDIYNRNDIPLTPDALRRLADIESQVGRRLTNDEGQVVRNALDDILANADDGVLTGQKYQAVRSQIMKAEGNDKVGQAVKEIRKALDDTAANAVGPEDAAILKKIRGQWANLRTTEDALKQVAGAGGNVRPAALWPLIRNGSTKEMRELARIGQNVLKDGIGDSGTAQRDFWMRTLGGGGAVAGAGTIGLAPMLLKAMAGGALAGRVLNSNTASKVLKQGNPSKGLAKMLQYSPRVLPAVGPAAYPVDAEVVGGTPVDPAELERRLRAQGY